MTTRYHTRKTAGLCPACGEDRDDQDLAWCSTCRERNQRSKVKGRKRIQKYRVAYKVTNWPKRMINASRAADRRMMRYVGIEDQYIDDEFLREARVQLNNRCCYCRIIMQVEQRRSDNGLTIERENNMVGHSKNNTTLCCYPCNIRRLTNPTTTDRVARWLEHRIPYARKHNVNHFFRQVINEMVGTVTADTGQHLPAQKSTATVP